MRLTQAEKRILNSPGVEQYMLDISVFVDSILPILFTQGIINTPTMQLIDSERTNDAKMVKLLQFLEAGLESLDQLIQAFKGSENTRRIGEELEEHFSSERTRQGQTPSQSSNVGSKLIMSRSIAIGSDVTSTPNPGEQQQFSSSSGPQAPIGELDQQDTLVVGNYCYQAIEKCRLGSGAYGKVYKGRSREDEFDEVAVKIVDFPDNEDYQKLLALLKNLVGKTHDNIISYLQVTTENQNMYIVTERCQTDLEKIIKGGRRNLEYLHSITQQLAEGYHALYHDYAVNFNGRLRRIIHRDIKPANLLITNLGPKFILKIGDFGCSELVRQNNSYFSGRSGDPGYWAPEMINPSDRSNRPRGNHKVDIWSMGIVILEAALGKHPIGHIEDVREGYEVHIPEDFVISTHPETQAERRHCERLRDMLEKMFKYDYHDRASIDEFHAHPFHQYPFIRSDAQSDSE